MGTCHDWMSFNWSLPKEGLVMGWRNPRVGDRVKSNDDIEIAPCYRNKTGTVEEVREESEIAFVRMDDPQDLPVGFDFDDLEIIF